MERKGLEDASDWPSRSAGYAPESILVSIQRAIALGVDLVEVDKGYLILLHDEQVNRTTNGIGRVADMTLDQVQKLIRGMANGFRHWMKRC
jgi:glycerophosphoryl diester phosphodiesterase